MYGATIQVTCRWKTESCFYVCCNVGVMYRVRNRGRAPRSCYTPEVAESLHCLRGRFALSRFLGAYMEKQNVVKVPFPNK